ARVSDLLARVPEIQARSAPYDEGVSALRSGSADAVLAIELSGPTILLEGSDPLRSGGVLATVQKGLLSQAVPGLAAPRIEYLYGGPTYTLLDYLAPVLISFFAFF